MTVIPKMGLWFPKWNEKAGGYIRRPLKIYQELYATLEELINPPPNPPPGTKTPDRFDRAGEEESLRHALFL